ncbi:MAG: hypothetical protein MJ051_05835 [Akkermansia sp.]|nr:hypothetical protein [Akkermansia sp.]
MQKLGMMSAFVRSLSVAVFVVLSGCFLTACGGGGGGSSRALRTADEVMEAFAAGRCMLQMQSAEGNRLDITPTAGEPNASGQTAVFSFNQGADQLGRIRLSKVSETTVRLEFPAEDGSSLELPQGWAAELSGDSTATEGRLKYHSNNQVLFYVADVAYMGQLSGSYRTPTLPSGEFSAASSNGACRALLILR